MALAAKFLKEIKQKHLSPSSTFSPTFPLFENEKFFSIFHNVNRFMTKIKDSFKANKEVQNDDI